MAITTKRTRFSRRLPDHVTDELCNVLAEKKMFGFNDLFERVFANLKVRNAVSGGACDVSATVIRLNAAEAPENRRLLVELAGCFKDDYEPMSSPSFTLVRQTATA